MKTIKAALILMLAGSLLYGQEYPVKQITFSKTTHDGYPYWTPDGKFIIYDAATRTECQAMKVPAGGGTPVRLTNCFSQHSDLSADGRLLVFDGESGTMIQMTEITGGEPVRIVPPTIPIVRSGYPRWSSDSKLIAFQSVGDVWIMGVANKNFSKICHADGKVMIPFCWVPGDREILIDVRDTTTKQSDIWRISLEEKDPVQLTSFGAYTAKPDISPDGSMIVFTSNHGGNMDLWVMKFNGGPPVQLTFFKGEGNNPGYDLEASWSPDGRKIAFSSTRSGFWAIWVMEPDLGELRKELGL